MICSTTLARIGLATGMAVGVALLTSAPVSPFSSRCTPLCGCKLVNFGRPGLIMNIHGAVIDPDGTIGAGSKLTDPQGLPLDREGISRPGAKQ